MSDDNRNITVSGTENSIDPEILEQVKKVADGYAMIQEGLTKYVEIQIALPPEFKDVFNHFLNFEHSLKKFVQLYFKVRDLTPTIFH